MDQDTLRLTIELVALFVLGALGIWRIYYRHQHTVDDEAPPAFDMRRDGQRTSAQM